MIIKTCAYPRAGLIGNPSDGYFGKTIAMAFTNFSAEIEMWESPELELLPSRRDHSVFSGIAALSEDVRLHGYYGGFRLLKATVRCFHQYVKGLGIQIDDRNFTLRYRSDIPNRVGMAGSSAIITAVMRALMGFYNVSISHHLFANLVRAVENDELGIPCGLQDRVTQAYQGLVYMDFSRDLMESRGYGQYELLDAAHLPRIYVAYREDLSEGTEVYHNNLRARWTRGDEDVVAAMKFWATITDQFRDALNRDDVAAMNELINAGFDQRSALYDVGEGNREMVAVARAAGASAAFAGSGGAIVGLFSDDAMFRRLEERFAPKGIRVIQPQIAPPRSASPLSCPGDRK